MGTTRFGDLDFSGIGIAARTSDYQPSVKYLEGMKSARVFGFILDPVEFASGGGLWSFDTLTFRNVLSRAASYLEKLGYTVMRDTNPYATLHGNRVLDYSRDVKPHL
jgi:hypothetical protein